MRRLKMSGSRTKAAALQLVLSSALFALMAFATKVVSARIPGAQSVAVRFATGVVVTAIGWMVGRIVLRPQRWTWLVVRGLFGGTAALLYFLSIERVPVGVATLLNQTQPIYTMIFGWLLLRERPTRAALLALPLTLSGVVLIVGVRVTELHLGYGEALGVLSAVLSGVAVTAIRAARRDASDGKPGDTTWSVFFSFTAFGLLVTAPLVLPPFGRWVEPTAREWGWLLGVGLAGVSAQIVMTHALRHIGGATAGIIAQLVVLLTVAGGAVFLGDELTLAFLAGGALALAGVVLVVASASPRQPPPVSTD